VSEKLSDLEPLELESLTIAPTGSKSVRMRGTITIRDPNERVRPYLRRVHEAAIHDQLSELHVDLMDLSFVSSSGLRLFIDWTIWLQKEPKRYRLVFFTNPRLTWQRTSFGALCSMASSVIDVRRG
jgi:hypothetical protein